MDKHIPLPSSAPFICLEGTFLSQTGEVVYTISSFKQQLSLVFKISIILCLTFGVQRFNSIQRVCLIHNSLNINDKNLNIIWLLNDYYLVRRRKTTRYTHSRHIDVAYITTYENGSLLFYC